MDSRSCMLVTAGVITGEVKAIAGDHFPESTKWGDWCRYSALPCGTPWIALDLKSWLNIWDHKPFSINFIYRHFHFIDYHLVFSQTPLEVLQLILSNISHSFIRNVMVPKQWRVAFRNFIAVWVWYVACIIGDVCGKNSPNMVSKL